MSLELDFELAQTENKLLRFYKAWVKAKGREDDMSDELANNIESLIPKYISLIDKKIMEVRVMDASDDEKANKIQELAESRLLWGQREQHVERYLNVGGRKEMGSELLPVELPEPKRHVPPLSTRVEPTKPMFKIIKKKPATEIIEKLVKMANSLDKSGLYKEANDMDEIIKSAISDMGETTEKLYQTYYDAENDPKELKREIKILLRYLEEDKRLKKIYSDHSNELWNLLEELTKSIPGLRERIDKINDKYEKLL